MGLVGFLAVGADLADQPLGDDTPEGAGNQVGLHADILQTVDDGNGIVGVVGGQHQVAGNGRPDGDLGRLSVPDLAYGDDIRVLTEDGPKSGGKGHAGLLVDLALVDTGDIVLHRVLQGHDVGFLAAQLPEHGAHGGGLTGAGRAYDEDHAGGIFQQRLILLQVILHANDIHRIILFLQRPVIQENLVQIFQVTAWTSRIFNCPPVVPVNQNGRLRITSCPQCFISKLLQFFTKL